MLKISNFKFPISKNFLAIFFGVFLLAAGCNKSGQQQLADSNHQVRLEQSAQPTSTLTTDVLTKGQTQTKQNAEKQDYTPGFIVVSQKIENSQLDPISVKIKEGQTAEDLLKQAHKIEVKSYSFGDMVIGIDGQKPDNKHFWEFFVNGKTSNVGASAYVLKDGDVIEWKMSEINSYK